MNAPAMSPYPHIEIDSRGVPLLSGTTMKVVELIMAQKAHGWSPEELHFQHPYLPLSQIHSALAYYWDHREEMEVDIESRSRYVEEVRREIGPGPLAERLKARRSQA